ncbi:MAG: hypothetical protein JSV31_18350 [Desulfobacterales bacterium]|nr:MAG: hypothetical protein JSV31_18350 [Desulfobacterales bacterium]
MKSYLMAKDFFRYMFPSKAPIDKQLVFFPYWRFKGMLFACNPKGINHKFIDVSHQAIKSHYIPHSVGLRSQALKLQFIAPETEGRFLKPTQSLDHVIQTFKHRFGKTLVKPILHQSHIGETISLLYSPTYIKDKVYDALLNQPVSSLLPDDFDIEQFPGGAPDWRIQFISTLCPNCGWDLEGERDTLVLLCKNCTAAWYAAGNSLKQLKFGLFPCGKKNGIYLPFWRIRADIKGIQLDSYADLIRVANLPKVALNKWHELGFRFWAPAFKVRPRVFLRLSSNMTLSQPHENLTSELPNGRHQPITMPVTEAVDSLTINLSSFIKPQTKLVDLVPEVKIDAKSFVLVYLPFQEGHHEFIQSDLQLAISKNTLSLSRNL